MRYEIGHSGVPSYGNFTLCQMNPGGSGVGQAAGKSPSVDKQMGI